MCLAQGQVYIVDLKIDKNCCKQTLAILGVQVVSVYSYTEPTTDNCIGYVHGSENS